MIFEHTVGIYVNDKHICFTSAITYFSSDGWFLTPSPSPRVCADGRLYADAITKFSQLWSSYINSYDLVDKFVYYYLSSTPNKECVNFIVQNIKPHPHKCRYFWNHIFLFESSFYLHGNTESAHQKCLTLKNRSLDHFVFRLMCLANSCRWLKLDVFFKVSSTLKHPPHVDRR